MKLSTDAGRAGWTNVQKLLHWVIAAAVIYQLSLGFTLMLVRLGWRLAHAAPSPPSNLSPMLARAARATHLGLYAALLLLPLSGLLHVVITHDHVPLLGTDLPGFGAHGKVGTALWWARPWKCCGRARPLCRQ